MKHWLGWVLLFAGLGSGMPALADPPSDYSFVSYDEGLRQARQQGKPIFLYFGRYGCAWCDKTNKESFAKEDVRQAYSAHYVLVYVDSESGQRLKLPSGERISGMELGARYRVFATPVFMFMEPDGKEIVKIPGFKTADDFRDYDRFVHEGHYKSQTLLQFLDGKAQ